MQVVDVNILGASYGVSIKPGLRHDIARALAACGLTPSSVALIVDAAIAASHGADAAAGLRTAGLRRLAVLAVTASEENKSLSTVESLCQGMLEHGLDRTSVVVAMGGGMVGDVAGFAAASYMRGVACVQMPTSLLAMVDASIGGKTGVNVLQRDGTLAKNMVGAFWQPRAVLCDPEVLRTLPPRELTCGLAECVKHAVIADPALLDLLLASVRAVRDAKSDACASLVARAAAVKAAIVARDEREDGVRAHLNLGHTFAHAIEALDHANVKHGEAVAIGMVAAAHVAATRGGAAEWNGHAPSVVMTQLGLPARLPNALPLAGLMKAMQSDKKAVYGRLRLVLPFAMGDVRVVEGVDSAAVEAAWHAVGAR